jgi:hypothetical protein
VNNARGPIGGLLRAVDLVVNLTLSSWLCSGGGVHGGRGGLVQRSGGAPGPRALPR